jgi:hypothetical protein
VAAVLVNVAAAIEALRAELSEAMVAGARRPMRFGLEPIELTLQVAVTNEGGGKIGWKILEVGGKHESVTTQTLTLRLRPMWELPDGSVTADFAIASQTPAGQEQHFGPRPPASADAAVPDVSAPPSTN